MSFFYRKVLNKHDISVLFGHPFYRRKLTGKEKSVILRMSDHCFRIFRKPYSSVKYVVKRLTKLWEKHKLPAETLQWVLMRFFALDHFLLKFELEPHHQNQT